MNAAHLFTYDSVGQNAFSTLFGNMLLLDYMCINSSFRKRLLQHFVDLISSKGCTNVWNLLNLLGLQKVAKPFFKKRHLLVKKVVKNKLRLQGRMRMFRQISRQISHNGLSFVLILPDYRTQQ